MGSGTRRDASAVRDGLAAWLVAERGTDDVVITRCDVPVAGMSSETFLLDATVEGRSERMVVRLAPPDDGLFPDYDLAAQCDVAGFVARHGIPAPIPTLVEADTWLGAAFVVMPFVAGHVPGSIPLVDPWIGALPPERRAHLYDGALDVVARLHRLDPDGVPAGVPRRDLDAELAEWGRYLDWYADGEPRVPALHRALDWCTANRPLDDPPSSLLWGDVRLGNLIVDEQADVVAVLDWEMTTVGAAEHDIAWWQVLEATQDELVGRRVDGFPELGAARADHERRIGRELQQMEWFEVFAMLRSSAIMTRAAIREEHDGRRPMLPVDDNPVLDLLERMVRDAGGVTR
jgi:aminoglycoside phosphotransferase (APT) family kinase protein